MNMDIDDAMELQLIEERFVEHKRWAVVYARTVVHEGEPHEFVYSCPATEIQDFESLNEEPVELVPVTKHDVMGHEWRARS